MGRLSPSQASISLGTAAAINVVSPRYIEPLPLFPAYPSAWPGHYNLEVQIFSGFWLVSWFLREFGLQEKMDAAEIAGCPGRGAGQPDRGHSSRGAGTAGAAVLGARPGPPGLGGPGSSRGLPP